MEDVAEQRHKDPGFRRTDRVGGADKREYWTKEKNDEWNLPQLLCVQAMRMEGIMSFAAEWCTADEVLILRCVSVSLLVVVQEYAGRN